MKMRYELKNEGSSKFWEIQVERKSYTIRSGKIGDEGCVRKETCSSKEEALKEANIAAAEKVSEGYVLIPGDYRAVGGLARRAANLRKKLAVTPENIDGWVDYGYFLQSLHDAHGVQITTLGDRLTKHPDCDDLQDEWSELLTKYDDGWLDEVLTRGIDANWSVTVDLEWKSGYISKAKLITMCSETLRTRELLQALLNTPSSLFLRDLSLGVYELFGDIDEWFRYQDCIDILANAATRPFIRNLYIGESDADTSAMDIGDVSGLYTVMPNLEVLKICGNYITFGKLHLKKLKRLDVLTVGLSTAQVHSIANAILPELETLNIWVGDAYNGAVQTFGVLKTLILRLETFHNLQHLCIANSEFQDEIVQEILGSTLISQLKTLDLSMGTMTNRGARALLAEADALQHIESIDVGANYIGEDLVAELKAVFPKKIKSRYQDDFDYYYDEDEFENEDAWIEHELSTGDYYVTISE